MHHACRVESLEARLAPAGIVTFIDVDGDDVTVTSSKGDSAALAKVLSLNPVGVGSQLLRIDLSQNKIFSGTNLSVTARPGTLGGDGFVNVGFVNATGLSIGAVKVAGDLGKLTSGIGNAAIPSLRSLDVQSLGRYGTSTGAPDLFTSINDACGSITIRGDVVGARLNIATTATSLRIGGSLIGGSVNGDGNIAIGNAVGSLVIGGSVLAGTAANTARVSVLGSVKTLSIGGDVIGGTFPQSATVSVAGATVGPVAIKGSVVGGSGNASGQVLLPKVASLTVGGDVLGGDGDTSGRLEVTNSVTTLDVAGSVLGGDGDFSGRVIVNSTVPVTPLKTATIRGSVAGGGGDGSGTVLCFVPGGTLAIGKDVRGGAGASSGAVTADTLQRLTIGGSVFAGPGVASGGLRVGNSVGVLRIAGSVAGTASRFALITAGGAGQSIGSLSVGGRMEKSLVLAGYSQASTPQAVSAGSIGGVTVGGDLVASSIVAGVRNPGFPNFGNDADIAFPSTTISRIGAITVRGSVMGTIAAGDHFGFVAEQIGGVTIGKTKQTIPAVGGFTAIGTTGDVTIHVVAPG